MAQHKAAYLDKVGTELVVRDTETKAPADDEVQIEVKAIAINPVDWKVQDTGIFLKSYPAVLGEDLAGTIKEAGSAVKSFKKGDRVLAHSSFLIDFQDEHGGFQEIVNVPETQVARVPDSMEFKDAVVLPLAISTAATGLYDTRDASCLALDLPKIVDGGKGSEKSTGKTLLIWGGSASVGTAAIQLARASGATVVTTCSKRNFDFVQSLGAKPFDYNSPSVVGDLVAELKKGEFVGGYDCIGSRESGMQCAQVIAQFGGGVMADVLNPPEDIAATVSGAAVFALTIFHKQEGKVGKAVWTDFLPEALKNGQIIPVPRAEVVGHGVNAIQEACQKQKAGVSAKKIVVTF